MRLRSRRNAGPGWRAALAALVLSPLAALAGHDADRLQRLLEEGRADAAWALAQEHRAAHEGEPRFDLHYAIAAIGAGEPGEAVFALRRVLAVRPGLMGARVYLGRAWLQLGEDLRARQELERVLAQDPPAPLRARVERYLAALDRRAGRYRTVVDGHIELGGGHDTNVNSAPDTESIDLATGSTAPLDTDQQQLADAFARVAGAVRVSTPVTPGLNLFAAASGSHRATADHPDFDVGQAGLRTGVVARGDDVRTTLSLRGERVYVGGDGYRDTVGVDAGLRHALSQRLVVELAADAARLRHETLEYRDSDLWTVGGGISRAWDVALQPTLELMAFVGAEDAERDSRRARARAQRDIHGVGAELVLRPAARWRVRTELDYVASEYDADDPAFGVTRIDDHYRGELALEWRPRPQWRIEPRVSHAVTDSNIELFEHERSVAALSVRYEF